MQSTHDSFFRSFKNPIGSLCSRRIVNIREAEKTQKQIDRLEEKRGYIEPVAIPSADSISEIESDQAF